MRKLSKVETRTTAILLFALAFIVSLHQYLNYGEWFQLKDLHHESFIIALVFGGFLFLLKGGGK